MGAGCDRDERRAGQRVGRANTGALPDVLADLADVETRGRLQTGARLAGLCLAQTRMGLHHQLAHALGGTFDLPHTELHSLLLAHVMRFNLPRAPGVADRLERVLGDDPTAVVEALARSHDGPTTLRDLGVPRDGLAAVADRVVASPYPNPRPVERGPLLDLLETARG
ncbi:dehydroquinate synthase/iron-containing alcohol dehydrogenase family protein [Nocardioides hungaricus]